MGARLLVRIAHRERSQRENGLRVLDAGTALVDGVLDGTERFARFDQLRDPVPGS
jgi:hypothetical protein